MTLLDVLQHLERRANPDPNLGYDDSYRDVFTEEECAILFEAFISMTATINESVEIIGRCEDEVVKLTAEIEEKRKIWTP